MYIASYACQELSRDSAESQCWESNLIIPKQKGML